jgi:cholesterol transport system auxiliary component
MLLHRSIGRLTPPGASLLALRLAAPVAALVCGMLAGCAGTHAANAETRYDLGPATQTANANPLPAVKVLDVSAPGTLDSDKLVYRLTYADAQQTASYAHSRWTMPPAQLLTQRLRAGLAARGVVLTGEDGAHAPVLKIDLEAFEQDFDAQTQSHATVSARATLFSSGKVLGQHTFVASAPASTPDAAGGARALAVASDDLIAQISTWLGTQALVAAQ